MSGDFWDWADRHPRLFLLLLVLIAAAFWAGAIYLAVLIARALT